MNLLSIALVREKNGLVFFSKIVKLWLIIIKSGNVVWAVFYLDIIKLQQNWK